MNQEELKIIWTLLQRVDLKGSEATAAANVMVKLSNMINAEPKEGKDEIKESTTKEGKQEDKK